MNIWLTNNFLTVHFVRLLEVLIIFVNFIRIQCKHQNIVIQVPAQILIKYCGK